MADIAKLDAILSYIEEHPKEWRQSTFGYREPSCGTVGCVAFHAGRLDGAEVEFTEQVFADRVYISTIGGLEPGEYGRRSLGLTEDQEEVLFDESNTLDGLKALRDALANDPGASFERLDAIAERYQ